MNNEALKRSFEKRAKRVMNHADEFGKMVSGRVGEYLVSAPNKMNPFWQEPTPVGFIQITIQRLDNQPIDLTEINDLTSTIDSEAANYGSTWKGAWMPKTLGKEVDHTVYGEWIGFEVKTTAMHRQLVKRLERQKKALRLKGRVLQQYDRRLSPIDPPNAVKR